MWPFHMKRPPGAHAGSEPNTDAGSRLDVFSTQRITERSALAVPAIGARRRRRRQRATPNAGGEPRRLGTAVYADAATPARRIIRSSPAARTGTVDPRGPSRTVTRPRSTLRETFGGAVERGAGVGGGGEWFNRTMRMHSPPLPVWSLRSDVRSTPTGHSARVGGRAPRVIRYAVEARDRASATYVGSTRERPSNPNGGEYRTGRPAKDRLRGRGRWHHSAGLTRVSGDRIRHADARHAASSDASEPEIRRSREESSAHLRGRRGLSMHHCHCDEMSWGGCLQGRRC